MWQTLLDSFFAPDIWAEHWSEIQQIIDWTRQNHTPLIAIVWPMLDHIDLSARQAALVENVFHENGVPVISAPALFRSDPPGTLAVNDIDSHLNEQTDKRMAEAIYGALQVLPQTTLDTNHELSGAQGSSFA